MYAVQALNAGGGAFTADLHIRYGSQDRFTFFTPFYRALIEWLGLSAASVVLLAAGQALWLGGLWSLAGRFARDTREWGVTATLAIALPAAYGGFHIFAAGEGFLTPRLYAEGLAMLALAQMASGRVWLAGLLLPAAAALHPLMAAPAVAATGAWWALGRGHRRRWAAIGAGGTAAAVVVLAAAGVEPFARLFGTFDADWFSVVHHRTGFAFLLQWQAVDFAILMITATTVAAGALVATPRERRLLAVLAAVAAGGLLVTLLGADLARNVFVVNVQPWRALWPLALVANICVGLLLCRLPRRDSGSGTALAAAWALAGLLLLSRFDAASSFSAAAASLVMLLAVAREAGAAPRPVPPAARAAAYVVIGLCVAFSVLSARFLVTLYAGMPVLDRILFAAGLILAIVTVAVMVFRRSGNRYRMMLAAAALVTISAAFWDRRDTWTQYVEKEGPAPVELSALLAEGQQVFWEDGVEFLWLKARRPSYYSCLQGTGAMFFRDTALDYARRTDHVDPLHSWISTRNGTCGPGQPADAPPHELTVEVLRAACRGAQDLDSVVLAKAVGGASLHGIWRPPVRREHVARDRDRASLHYIDAYFIYRCADLRRPAVVDATH